METLKKFLIFQETELSYISGGTYKHLKNKQKKSALKKFLVSYDVFTIFTA